LLLAIAFPINCIVVLASLVWSKNKTVPNQNPQNILLTGGKMTKALQLARSFHAAGDRVVLVETEKYWLTGHQFSKAVDCFYTLPAPETNPGRLHPRTTEHC
jgi:hypothetical protein